jgi:hypothetical protein
MKYLFIAAGFLFCLVSCRKNVPQESQSIENIPGTETLTPIPAPTYKWAELPRYEMPSYPFNSPDYKNIVMNVDNNVYLLTGSTFERKYKLDNNTKQWQPYSVPSNGDQGFALFVVGYQYLFSYQGKIYGGLQQGGTTYNETVFFSLNPVSNTTTDLATFPGRTTANALSFIAGDKGYVVSGFTAGTYPQIWEYNFATNVWTNKGNSPLGRRYDACVFVANNKIYMGMGYQNINFNGQPVKLYKKDWIEYTPGSAYSGIKANFPGAARGKAKGFVINNTPHVGFGNNSSDYFTDMWKYNTTTNTWTQQPDWPTVPYIVDYNIGTFNLGTTGYLVTGAIAKFWRYSNSIFYP